MCNTKRSASFNQREIKTEQRVSDNGQRRGRSDKRAARHEVRVGISGLWVKIKILCAHQGTASDFLKNMGQLKK